LEALLQPTSASTTAKEPRRAIADDFFICRYLELGLEIYASEKATMRPIPDHQYHPHNAASLYAP
jgi:hypothetical protein